MSGSRPAENVTFHYTGKLESGQVFDTSRESEPITIKLGEGKTLLKIEQALAMMQPGDQKTVEISAEDAFGPWRGDAELKLPRSQFAGDMKLATGQRLQITQENGRPAVVKVKKVDDQQVVLDTNHPLAGEDVTFELELLDCHDGCD